MVGGGRHVAFAVPDFATGTSELSRCHICPSSRPLVSAPSFLLFLCVCPLTRLDEEGGLVLPGRHPLCFACIGCEKGLQDPRRPRLSLGVGGTVKLCVQLLFLSSPCIPPRPLSRWERTGESDSPSERFVGPWCREEPCLGNVPRLTGLVGTSKECGSLGRKLCCRLLVRSSLPSYYC